MSDVITVPSHTKKDNPEAALKPRTRRQLTRTPTVPRHVERPGTTAAALCIAGCEYVVATLWPVADDHAVDFAARLYGELVTAGNGTAALHPEGTPRVMREVCLAIRDAYPQHPERWVPSLPPAPL